MKISFACCSVSQPIKEDPLEGGDGTIDDLKEALVENLEQRGVLGKLRAKASARSGNHEEVPRTMIPVVDPPPLVICMFFSGYDMP